MKIQEELASAQKELDDALDDYAELDIKVKATLMKQFLDGKALEWRPQEVIDRFLANGGTLDELEEDAAVASTADSGPGPSVTIASSVAAVDVQPPVAGDQPAIVVDQPAIADDQPVIAADQSVDGAEEP